jgi:hypothetical protein
MATSLQRAPNVDDQFGKAGKRQSPFWRRPTTWLAAGVLTASALAALVVGNHGSATGSVAAKVGPTSIPDAAVDREAAAIQSQPLYKAVLSHASTLALAAPISPHAIAATNGDPDDLRVSFAAPGANNYRPYTISDLKAAVLTRLMYLAALRQVLADRHVSLTANDMAWGRQEARVAGGQDDAGAFLFDQLPKWYQDQLASRGAAVFALTRALVGNGGITAADVEGAYLRLVPTEFTTWCLRSVVIPAAAVSSGRSTLLAGEPGGRDDGCAPFGGWAPDVQAAIRNVAVGQVAAPVRRGQRVALLLVQRRVSDPFPAVEGSVRAGLDAQYSEPVNVLIQNKLALDDVAVSAHYGTYQHQGNIYSVVPPDALAPPPASRRPTPASPPQRQQQDPFE